MKTTNIHLDANKFIRGLSDILRDVFSKTLNVVTPGESRKRTDQLL